MTPFFECMTLGLNGSLIELEEGMTKVIRVLRTVESATLDGQRIYYNHIRPHQGLSGKTPAQAAGLKLDLGVNKWKTLIQNASRGSKLVGEDERNKTND